MKRAFSTNEHEAKRQKLLAHYFVMPQTEGQIGLSPVHTPVSSTSSSAIAPLFSSSRVQISASASYSSSTTTATATASSFSSARVQIPASGLFIYLFLLF